MKMCAGSSIVLALLVSGIAVVRGFISPSQHVKLTATHGIARPSGIAVPRAAGAEPQDGESTGNKAKGGLSIDINDVGSQISTTRDQLRDFIWRATDTIAHAVEEMPEFGFQNTTQTLSRVGSFLGDIDDKYFSKYLSAGSTPGYQDTLAAATSSATSEKGGGGEGKVAAPREGDVKEDTSKMERDEAAKARAVSWAVANAEATAKKVEAAASKKMEGSASGTVKLDRPTKVQGVFDDIQAQAVEYYKSNPASATPKGTTAAVRGASGGREAGGVATPLPEAIQVLEAKLESYMTETNLKPNKLAKKEKTGLVATLSAMEAAYPADANPLGDPALSGQWSMVYSSSSKAIRRALRGILVGLFKTSDSRQVVDAGASTVMNACRARLRLTPLALRVAKKGSYRPTGTRKAWVEMPQTKKGVIRRLLPSIRAGKVEAEVTYLSSKWRIVRANGVTVAFRKSGT